MQIIKFKKIKGGKYKVFFNNDSNIVLHEDIILKYNLITNKYIESDIFDEIIADNSRYLVYDQALKYINVKLRSELEIRNYLKKKNIDEELIDEVIINLRKKGYLNDETYIKAYIYDKINISKLGPNKIKEELLKLNFDEDVIDAELSKIDINIINENLKRFIDKKINSTKNYSGNVLKQKILSYFIDKGYDKKSILAVLNDKNLNNEELLKREYNKLYNKYSKKYSGDELKMVIKQKLFQKGFNYNDI